MPFEVLRHLRRSARHMACSNPLYNWSLSGAVPDRLLVRPVDAWAGNAEAGQCLSEGAFMICEDRLEISQPCWEPLDIDEAWLVHMHGFTWLRDLRALGGRHSRLQARIMIESWIDHYPRWSALAWRPDIAGERIAMWIAHYEFFDEPQHEPGSADFNDLFFDSLVRQARHIAQSLPGDLHGIAALKAIKGLLYAGLGFEGCEHWIAQALSLLEDQTREQILADGAHVSRSPAALLSALQIYVDIRTALFAAGHPLPESVQHAIDRMVPALRFFRYNDKGLALFNGAQEGDVNFMESVLAQSGSKVKALSSLPCAGYERAMLGRSMILFDCGRSPDYPHDAAAHAAPLAFEMTYGKDRVIVSCGTHPSSAEWQDALRATAAHSALTVAHRNACEIRETGRMSRKVRMIDPIREDTKSSCLLEGVHDGYLSLFGITHRRRIYMADQGHDIRGEDTLICEAGPVRPLDFAIRFHIHPRVNASLIRDGEEALLRLPSGIGWRFHHSAGRLMLEDSIYLGEGSRPRKTKQLVIYGQISDNNEVIKWALQREGCLKT
jgi:uncharacterized heparinase superfamily protein